MSVLVSGLEDVRRPSIVVVNELVDPLHYRHQLICTLVLVIVHPLLMVFQGVFCNLMYRLEVDDELGLQLGDRLRSDSVDRFNLVPVLKRSACHQLPEFDFTNSFETHEILEVSHVQIDLEDVL